MELCNYTYLGSLQWTIVSLSVQEGKMVWKIVY